MTDLEYQIHELSKGRPAEADTLFVKARSADGESRWVTVSVPQFDAMLAMLALTNPEWRLHQVYVDGEVITVPARDIWHAFAVARALRPSAVVVTDTRGR